MKISIGRQLATQPRSSKLSSTRRLKGSAKIARQGNGLRAGRRRGLSCRSPAPAPDPEQLFQLALKAVGATGKIAPERRAQLRRLFGLRFALGSVDNNGDRLVGIELARPANDIVLGVLVEIAFAKRVWIEAVEELGDLVDAKLDCFGWDLCGHRLTQPRSRPSA